MKFFLCENQQVNRHIEKFLKKMLASMKKGCKFAPLTN